MNRARPSATSIDGPGSIPGYDTELEYLPARRATVVVLVNTDISNAQGNSPASTLFDALAKVVAPRNAP